MNCTVMTFAAFVADKKLALDVAERLARPGSDFQNKIMVCIIRQRVPSERDGVISIVRDRAGKVIGWARSERWADADGLLWSTLEAFVAPAWRDHGIATFAAAGLFLEHQTSVLPPVAVFRPSMMLLARRIGRRAVLHHKDAEGRWIRS